MTDVFRSICPGCYRKFDVTTKKPLNYPIKERVLTGTIKCAECDNDKTPPKINWERNRGY